MAAKTEQQQAEAMEEMGKHVEWAASTINLAFQASSFKSTGQLGPALTPDDIKRVIRTILGELFTGREAHDDFTPADLIKFSEGVIRWAAEELEIALPVGE